MKQAMPQRELPASNSRTGAIILDDLSGCVTRLALWERLLERVRPATMLELGVWKGEFAAFVLSHCPAVERYYMIDPWRPLPSWNKPLNVAATDFDAAYRAAMDATLFAERRITVLRGTTHEVIDQVPDGSLDLAYVDGDHTLRGITIDLINVYPKIKPGGYLCGDDFSPDVWQHDSAYEPTLVFPFAVYFAEAVGAPIHALPCKQFLIEKPKASGGAFAFFDHTGAYGDTQLRGALLRTAERDGALRRLGRKVKRLLD